MHILHMLLFLMSGYDMSMSGIEYYIMQCHDKAMLGTYIVITMSRYDITI